MSAKLEVWQIVPLPSTVIGLLFHAAEHTMRHVGQLMVTAAVVRSTEGRGLVE